MDAGTVTATDAVEEEEEVGCGALYMMAVC